MEKFKEKNIENIEKLNAFIDSSEDNLRLIIASPEMFAALEMYYGAEPYGLDDMIKYRGKRVIKDAFIHSHFIGFIMRDQMIRFNVPCLCGIYDGEVHP